MKARRHSVMEWRYRLSWLLPCPLPISPSIRVGFFDSASSPDPSRVFCVHKPCVCSTLFTYLKSFWLPGLFLCFTYTSWITQTWKAIWNQYPSILGKKMVEHGPSCSFAFAVLFTVSLSCQFPWVCNWPRLNPLFLSSVIYSWGLTLSWSFLPCSKRNTVITRLTLPGPWGYLQNTSD